MNTPPNHFSYGSSEEINCVLSGVPMFNVHHLVHVQVRRVSVSNALSRMLFHYKYLSKPMERILSDGGNEEISCAISDTPVFITYLVRIQVRRREGLCIKYPVPNVLYEYFVMNIHQNQKGTP